MLSPQQLRDEGADFSRLAPALSAGGAPRELAAQVASGPSPGATIVDRLTVRDLSGGHGREAKAARRQKADITSPDRNHNKVAPPAAELGMIESGRDEVAAPKR